MPLTQPGSWECQTRVWPRTFMPLLCAWLTILSAPVKVNESRDGSVASHFISFSGVTPVNSRFNTVVYADSPSRPLATAAPKTLPFALAAAPRVVAASDG